MMILSEQAFLSQKFLLIEKISLGKRSTAIEMAHEMSILRVCVSIYIVFKYL